MDVCCVLIKCRENKWGRGRGRKEGEKRRMRSFTWKWSFGEDRWHNRKAKHIHHSLSRIHSDSSPAAANVRLYRRLMSGLVTSATCTANSGDKKSSSGGQAVIKQLNDPFSSVKSWFSQEASYALGNWHSLTKGHTMSGPCGHSLRGLSFNYCLK